MPNYVTKLPDGTDPHAWFSDAADGKLHTLLDATRYFARLIPHIEKETLTSNDHVAAAEVCAAICDRLDAIDQNIVEFGVRRLLHRKEPPVELVKALAGVPVIREIVSHLEGLERYCSHAKKTYDMQQSDRLAWVPTPQYKPR